jgi:hypothetical protein
MPLHPVYLGAMRAADAGAATAYLALRLADEYHSEITTGYEVLERAGYHKTADIKVSQPVVVERR